MDNSDLSQGVINVLEVEQDAIDDLDLSQAVIDVSELAEVEQDTTKL